MKSIAFTLVVLVPFIGAVVAVALGMAGVLPTQPAVNFAVAAVIGGVVVLTLGASVIDYHARRVAELEALRDATNCCRRCGYDLRASTDRCPECGEPIPPPAPVVLAWTPMIHRVSGHAEAAARALGADYVGTEHVLLGLLREPDGAAAAVLANLGVTEAAVRAELDELFEPGDGITTPGPRLADVPAGQVLPRSDTASASTTGWASENSAANG